MLAYIYTKLKITKCYLFKLKHKRTSYFHLISFHFISFHFISFHFISFHFISFHFISFHFISFHFISFQHMLLIIAIGCFPVSPCEYKNTPYIKQSYSHMQNEIHKDTIIRNYIIFIKYERREMEIDKK